MSETEGESAGHAEIEARLHVVIARTAQRLSEADQSVLRQKIADSLELRRSMRTLALNNHDEPEHGFDPAASPLTSDGERR